MKALSVKQPWANMIAWRQKTIETRTWSTEYRGDLLIVSSRKPDIAPAGCAVALVELVECRPMTKADEFEAEYKLYDGAWAWMLQNIRRIRPIPIRGSLGIYDVDLRTEELVYAAY